MIYTIIKKNAQNVIDAIVSFDSISDFNEDWTATVTTQTVESGFDISDNVNIEPTSYSIDAVISGYSLFNLENEIVWDGDNFKSGGEGTKDSHIAVRTKLRDIFSSRSILTILESSGNSNNKDLGQAHKELTSGYFKEINNCVMTSLSIGHPQGGEGAFYVSIKLQKVSVALVTTYELSESEMQKELIPLKQKTESKSSTTKNEGSGDDIPNGMPDAAAVEASDLGIPSREVGISFATGAAQARSEIAEQEAHLRAANLARDLGAKDGRLWLPKEKGGVMGLEVRKEGR